MTPRACACADFSRTELLRRAAAEAGKGLPPIEPGMPLPAGTGLDRRTFLLRAAGAALAVYGAGRLGLTELTAGIAQAADGSPPVLVSVFLEGGADSLSILFPAGDPGYRRLRPKLALPAEDGIPFPDDDRLLWHPAVESLATLHGEGKLSVLPAVGYSDPDQSHFTSRHYWEVGATNASLRTGWLGRYLDVAGTEDNPLQGLSLDGRLSPALAAARSPVASVDTLDHYIFKAAGVAGQVEDRMLETLAPLAAAHSSGDAAVQQVARATARADGVRTQLGPFVDGFSSPVTYPESSDPFPQRLAGLAAIVAAGLPVRCVALTAPGMYDTHANQPEALASNLKLTADSLIAFQRDLEARGLADRVLVHVWSEFGRRGAENGSDGTDHGAAGIGFLLGTRVRGELIGEFPGLAAGLDADGNLRATADFRGLYSALLEQWLGLDAEAVIPDAARYARPALLS